MANSETSYEKIALEYCKGNEEISRRAWK